MKKLALAFLLFATCAQAQQLSGGSGGGGSSGLTVGTTTITGGTTTRILYDNAGVLGEYSLTGTGTVAVMQNTPTLITPVLGVANGTSLALGGATIGANALAVTGTANISGNTTLGSAALLLWSTDVNLSRNAAGIIQFGTTAANAAGSWLATNGTLSGNLTSAGLPLTTNSVAPAAAGIASLGVSDVSIYASGVRNFAFSGTSLVFLGSSPTVSLQSNTSPALIMGAASDTTLSRNAAGVFQFGTTALNASGAWLAAKGTLTGGTLADQAQVLAITATQPASPTGTQKAITNVITGAGSASQANTGYDLLYGAGYTGSSIATGMRIANATAGTVGSGLFVVMADTAPSIAGALVVDNSDKAIPIFLARDNGSTVFTIADGGTVTTTGGLSVGLSITAGQQINVGAANVLTWTGSKASLFSPNANTLRLNSSSGDLIVNWGAETSSFPAIKRSTTILQVRLADDSAHAPLEALTVRAGGFTVATLPTAGTAGRTAYVTDQLTTCAVAGAALTGGGAVVCPVFDNGVAWVGG